VDLRIPIRLEKDSIVESVFEVRFTSNEKLVSELLPGMMFSQLKDTFPTTVNLPMKEMPAVIRQRDPELMFQPVVSLEGNGCKVNIGDKAISLGIARPYIGWGEKKKLLATVLDCLSKTGLMDKVERYSLKYVNIVPRIDKAGDVFSDLRVTYQLGDFVVSDIGVNIRSEIELDGVLNIVNLVPGASYRKNNDTLDGVLVNVDSIKQGFGSGIGLNEVLQGADEVHQVEKRIFFGLLRPETIEYMGPIWE
jgi:uncharacterized protein (TIGR04255 family)